MSEYLIILLQGMAAYLIGTVLFDILHYFFHTWTKSKIKWLKALANMHMIHHRFYYASLKINVTHARKNFWNHVVVEYVVHLSGIFLCGLFFSVASILVASIFETIIFLSVCFLKGQDAHHRPMSLPLIAPRGGIFVNREYHALHHIYPHRFFSSIIKIFDYAFGTGTQLHLKHIAMTGASGALGRHMKILLEKEGARVTTFKFGRDYHYDQYETLIPTLQTADVLLLCHGTKYENTQQANCESYVQIIELFKKVRQPSHLPIEIWATGSEIECHPCFGIKKLLPYATSKRTFLKHAQQYFHSPSMHYRHLVHSAFWSPMGPGLITAKFAARWTLFLIKRGFKYVPVSYTGIAFINYFRHFLFKSNVENKLK